MPQIPLRDRRSFGRRISALILSFFVLIFLFSWLLIVNVTQTLSMVMMPFSNRAFRSYNRWAANTWWGGCVTMAKLCYNIRIEVSGDPLPSLESAIVVSNHQQMPDITFLMFLARDKGRLGDLKWFVKDSIKWIPGIGWGMVFIGCIFVKRNWNKDRASIERTFAWINKGRVPFWIMLFAEGTRITPGKLEKSRIWAEKKGIEPPKHVLTPRTKGFVSSVIGLRDGHLDAVYDLTIGYKDGVPTLGQYSLGACPLAHIHVRRFAVAELPQKEEELDTWLLDRFREKDDLLESFYAKGSFQTYKRRKT